MEPTPYRDYRENTPEEALPPMPMPARQDFVRTPAWAQDSYIQITELLHHFDRQTPVKHIADSLINGSYRPGDPIYPLTTALTQTNGNLWRERVAAIWALGRVQLTEQERDAAANMLMAILEEDARGTYWQRFGRGLMWGFGIAFPVAFLWSLREARHGGDPWLAILFQMIVVLGTIASGATVPLTMLFGKTQSEHQELVRQAAAETLGRLGVIESVGTLAGTLFDSSQLVCEASAQALHMLLPSLDESHYGLFGEQTMRSLGKALDHADINLVFKVLGALGQVGTSHAIPYVERVAKNGKTVRLRDEALGVLLRLDARKKRGDDANVLMRPSSSLTAPPGQLLRPAYSSRETDPLQLLRSTETPPDE